MCVGGKRGEREKREERRIKTRERRERGRVVEVARRQLRKKATWVLMGVAVEEEGHAWVLMGVVEEEGHVSVVDEEGDHPTWS